MNTADSFGRRLRQLRAENDLTQEQLVKELEGKGYDAFNKSTISRWENGLRKPKMEVIEELEDLLGASRGVLLRAAGYTVETIAGEPVAPQIDPLLLKQKSDHFTDLAGIAKALLCNGLENVSSPGWTLKPNQPKYVLPNEKSANGYEAITHHDLTSRLNSNMAEILKERDWFFRHCFVPHLKSELPEDLRNQLFYTIVESQPYKLINTLRIVIAGKMFKGTCPVCKDW